MCYECKNASPGSDDVPSVGLLSDDDSNEGLPEVTRRSVESCSGVGIGPMKVYARPWMQSLTRE